MSPTSDRRLKAVTEPLSAEEILERHIESIGGRERMERTRSSRYIGRIKVQGLSGTIESASRAPNKSYQKIDLGVYVEESGCDGEIAWKRGTRGTSRLTGPELVQARENALFNRVLRYRDPAVFAGVRSLGLSRETPAGEHVVEMVLASGNRFRSFYDAETFLEVKRVSQIQSADKLFEREVWFSDYRPLDGRPHPFSIRQVTPFNEVVIVVDEHRIDADDAPSWWEDVSGIFEKGL